MANNDARISLRLANDNDCERIFEWIQDPIVSRSGFTTHEIGWQEHQEWFKERRSDEGTVLYMGYLDHPDSPFGHVRFEATDDEGEISVIVKQSHRGRGLGTALIRVGTEEYLRRQGAPDRIVARIKEDNVRSEQAFENAGYSFVDRTTIKGQQAVIYEHST